MQLFNTFTAISPQTIEIGLLSLAVILLIGLILFMSRLASGFLKGLTSLRETLREDIKFAVSPKFMDLSLGVNELIDLAVEVWRIEQRIAKSASSLPEAQLKGLENSAQKLKRYLEKYDIEIIDYKNQKYNEGLNLDILSVEKDPTLQHSIVKETIEPTIMCKGQVVRKAKIILLSNN